MGVFEWTDEMKSAAMADAATVCKQAERIAELEQDNRLLAASVEALRAELGAIADRATKFRRMPIRDLANKHD